MMNKYLIIIALIFCLTDLNAQDLVADLEKIFQQYKGVSKAKIIIQNSVYENTKKIKDTEIIMYRNENKYRFENSNILTLRNKDFTLTVIKPQRVVKINKSDEKVINNTENQFLSLLTTQGDVLKEATFLGETDNIKKYIIKLDNEIHQFDRIEIELNTNSKRINKVVYYSKEIEGKMYRNEMLYRVFDINPQFLESEFSLDSIVKKGTVSNGYYHFTLQTQYQNYELINQSHIKG